MRSRSAPGAKAGAGVRKNILIIKKQPEPLIYFRRGQRRYKGQVKAARLQPSLSHYARRIISRTITRLRLPPLTSLRLCDRPLFFLLPSPFFPLSWKLQFWCVYTPSGWHFHFHFFVFLHWNVGWKFRGVRKEDEEEEGASPGIWVNFGDARKVVQSRVSGGDDFSPMS